MTTDSDIEGDSGQAGADVVVPGSATVPAEDAPGDLLAELEHSGRKVSPEKMRSIVDRILVSGRFCRDTEGGGLLHPKGKIAFRELTKRNSMHVSIGEEAISVHVDRVSPLSHNQTDDQDCGHCNYSFRRVVAHVTTNLFNSVFRRESRYEADKHMEISTTGAGRLEDEATSVNAEPASGRTPGPDGPPRTPFTAIDEAVYLLDTPVEPWTVQVEVRVGGSLDEARFRQALAAALALHPMARARTAPKRPRRPRFEWEITPALDVDPLEIVDCPDDEALGRARDDFYSLSVPLTTSPPLRIRLAHQLQGDVVMLATHHAAIDVIGGLRLLASIARAYGGVPDPLPEVDPLGVRDLKTLFGPRGATEHLRRIVTAAGEVWRLSHGPSRLASKDGQNRSGYGIYHYSLTPHQTRDLMAATGEHTVDDLLVCALHQAIDEWSLEYGTPAGRITVGVPVNLRRSEWHGEVAGNFLCMVPVSTMAADRRRPSGPLGAVALRMGQVKQIHSAAALVGLFGILQRLLPAAVKPAVVIRVTGNPFAPSALVHHLGVLDKLDFGEELGEVREAWISPPAMMPEALSIGVITAGGQLRLAFRYRLALWGAEETQQFATRYVTALEGLAQRSSSDPLNVEVAGSLTEAQAGIEVCRVHYQHLSAVPVSPEVDR
ncbi:MAG: hypothetical protein QOH66_2599 [Actinomycetota bacterium]|nr:hypothetical protein [Actinomycetota bacterium]